MLQFVFRFHSGMRWLVLLAIVIVLVRFLYGWLAKKEFAKLDSNLLMIFLILLDIQVTLGIILLFWSGLIFGFPMYHIEHAVVFFIALVLAHSTRKWNKAPSAMRFKRVFLVVLGIAVLVLVGVTRLPQGWNMHMGSLPAILP